VTRKINHCAYQREVVIHTVQNEDGSFRPLDQRTLALLQMADTWQRGVNATLDNIERENEKMVAEEERDFERDCRDMVRERLPYLRREVDNVCGALNIPREDLMRQIPTVSEADEVVRMGSRRMVA